MKKAALPPQHMRRIIGERVKTHAYWLNIIKSQFGTYVLIILIAIIVESFIIIFRD